MVIPLGMAGRPRSRAPIASIAITILSLIALLVAVARSSGPALSPQFHAFWKAHPYLRLPAEARERVTDEEIRQNKSRAEEMEKKARERQQAIVKAPVPIPDDMDPDEEPLIDVLPVDHLRDGTQPGATNLRGQEPDERQVGFMLASEQEQLDALAHSDELPDFMVLMDGQLSRSRFLIAMLLHPASALVIGMALFVIIGPAIEGALTWVAPPIAFALGTLFCALFQLLAFPKVGPQFHGVAGGLAACIGLFAVQFFGEHIKVVHFFLIRPQVTEWRAPVFAGIWCAIQAVLVLFALGHSHGPDIWAASLAQISGQLFGCALGVAAGFVLKLMPMSEHLEARADSDDTNRPLTPLERADQLLAEGNDIAALDGYREILRLDPRNVPAQFGLSRVLFLMGENEEGSRVFDAVVARWVAAGTALLIGPAVKVVVKDLDPRELRPEHAGLVAPHLDMLDPAKAQVAREVAARA